MKHIYLAGPIAGCSYGEATNWRVEFGSRLPPGVVGVSPMRNKEFLNRRKRIAGGSLDEQLMGLVSAVGTRDYYDVSHCDMVVAYLPKLSNDRRPSIGTLMELGTTRANGIPAILVTDDKRMTEHPLICDWMSWVVPTLDEALEVVGLVLEPYLEETE